MVVFFAMVNPPHRARMKHHPFAALGIIEADDCFHDGLLKSAPHQITSLCSAFFDIHASEKPAGSLIRNIRMLVARTLAQWPYGRAHGAQAVE
jgi:hypothetical protein